MEPLHDVNQQSLFCLHKELNKLTNLKWLALIIFEFSIILSNSDFLRKEVFSLKESSVTDGGEGGCVDPGEKEAILEARGPGLPGGGKGEQLASDSGGG